MGRTWDCCSPRSAASTWIAAPAGTFTEATSGHHSTALTFAGITTSKRIWALTQENRRLKTVRQIGLSPQFIASFGTDEPGNIYVVGYEGMVYKLDFSGTSFDGPVVNETMSALKKP